MLVKICGITNLDDALAAIQAGAGALGFNFWPKSPRYITPAAAAPILNALPAGICKVGIFVNDSGESVAAEVGLDVAQIHGTASAPSNVRYWRAVPAGAAFEDDGAEAFLVDTPAGAQHGGTGRTFDWSLLQNTPRRVVLAGGLDASNVAEAIRTVHPWGVDACSRLESSPGKKDHRKLAEFIRTALTASQS